MYNTYKNGNKYPIKIANIINKYFQNCSFVSYTLAIISQLSRVPLTKKNTSSKKYINYPKKVIMTSFLIYV